MKATIESTDVIVPVNGVQCRAWRARSERGVPFILFVQRIQVEASADLAEFERELREQPTPPEFAGGIAATVARTVL